MSRGRDARELKAPGVRDDNGHALRASWSIEWVSDGFRLYLESQSGRSSGPRARNPDYRVALGLLLRRLGDQDAAASLSRGGVAGTEWNRRIFTPSCRSDTARARRAPVEPYAAWLFLSGRGREAE